MKIDKAALGPNHPDVATTLSNLAGLHQDQGEYSLAKPLYERALKISGTALGPDHPRTLSIRESYETMLSETRRVGTGPQACAHCPSARRDRTAAGLFSGLLLFGLRPASYPFASVAPRIDGYEHRFLQRRGQCRHGP